jgi:hypothetical protein
VFLQSSNLSALPELQGKIAEFYERLPDAREKLKIIGRRLKTLDEHIKQTEILAKHKAVCMKYAEQKPKGSDRLYETNRAETTLYEAANRCMKERLNGRTAIPLKAWKTERAKLTGEQSALGREHKPSKEEVREAETMRRYAESVERAIAPHTKPRAQGVAIQSARRKSTPLANWNLALASLRSADASWEAFPLLAGYSWRFIALSIISTVSSGESTPMIISEKSS